MRADCAEAFYARSCCHLQIPVAPPQKPSGVNLQSFTAAWNESSERERLPLTATWLGWWRSDYRCLSIESLTSHGLSDEEIYTYIVPRRTLVHRKSKREPLTHDESDRAVRIARITSLAEEVFGDDAKAGRWLRKIKERFDGRTPLEVSRTEAVGRLVEEMLLQLDYGIFA